MALNQLQAGPQRAAAGQLVTARAGLDAEMAASQLHGRKYLTAKAGNFWSVSTQGTNVTTTAALATTWTGLGIANPTGSGVDLAVHVFTATQFAVGVAGTIGVMGAAGVLAASLTPQSRIIGSGKATLTTASASATISTPVLIATVGSVGSLATTGYGTQPGLVYDFEGGLIIPPGSFLCTYTSTAQTSAWQFSFSWEEIPA